MNCQLLLKTVISEEYFQQLQMYPELSADLVLARVTAMITEMQRYRKLIVGPAFSRRVQQIYFTNLDF